MAQKKTFFWKRDGFGMAYSKEVVRLGYPLGLNLIIGRYLIETATHFCVQHETKLVFKAFYVEKIKGPFFFFDINSAPRGMRQP